ncbi:MULTISPECIES: hypothetical protein [Spirulina sp. CCY15215]|uniref:hypothetical protein n=1 Tax=Spirulina sp. CCY15215 TaxID=2767591 RepID=UPI0019511E2A|nr:hypothetical protein [Spirulina major]
MNQQNQADNEFKKDDLVRLKENPGMRGKIIEIRESPTQQDNICTVNFGIDNGISYYSSDLEKYDPNESLLDLFEKSSYGNAEDFKRIFLFEQFKKYPSDKLYDFKEARRVLVLCKKAKLGDWSKLIKTIFPRNCKEFEKIDEDFNSELDKFAKSQSPQYFSFIMNIDSISRDGKNSKNKQEFEKILKASQFSKDFCFFDLAILDSEGKSPTKGIKKMEDLISKNSRETIVLDTPAKDIKKEINNTKNKGFPAEYMKEFVFDFLKRNQGKDFIEPVDENQGKRYKIELKKNLQESFKEFKDSKEKLSTTTFLHTKEVECYFDPHLAPTNILNNQNYELIDITHPLVKWIEYEYEKDSEKDKQFFHRLSLLKVPRPKDSRFKKTYYIGKIIDVSGNLQYNMNCLEDCLNPNESPDSTSFNIGDDIVKDIAFKGTYDDSIKTEFEDYLDNLDNRDKTFDFISQNSHECKALSLIKFTTEED